MLTHGVESKLQVPTEGPIFKSDTRMRRCVRGRRGGASGDAGGGPGAAVSPLHPDLGPTFSQRTCEALFLFSFFFNQE